MMRIGKNRIYIFSIGKLLAKKKRTNTIITCCSAHTRHWCKIEGEWEKKTFSISFFFMQMKTVFMAFWFVFIGYTRTSTIFTAFSMAVEWSNHRGKSSKGCYKLLLWPLWMLFSCGMNAIAMTNLTNLYPYRDTTNKNNDVIVKHSAISHSLLAYMKKRFVQVARQISANRCIMHHPLYVLLVVCLSHSWVHFLPIHTYTP